MSRVYSITTLHASNFPPPRQVAHTRPTHRHRESRLTPWPPNGEDSCAAAITCCAAPAPLAGSLAGSCAHGHAHGTCTRVSGWLVLPARMDLTPSLGASCAHPYSELTPKQALDSSDRPFSIFICARRFLIDKSLCPREWFCSRGWGSGHIDCPLVYDPYRPGLESQGPYHLVGTTYLVGP